MLFICVLFLSSVLLFFFFFSSRRRHTRCALVTGVQTCALPICPEDDAFLVQRLREAGAVILGKTNLSEWANIRSSRSTSGWSARGGQTQIGRASCRERVCPYV